MPKCISQLGARGTSPSICPQRATGCPIHLTQFVVRNSWDLVLALSLPSSTTSGLIVHLTTDDPENLSEDDVWHFDDMRIDENKGDDNV